MAGISNNKWILALAAVSLAFSCVKEASIEPVEKPEDEVFAEYDPVVRFGLETYMGPDQDTKTTYAGENKTVMFESKRYERINWNVDPSDTDNPQDVVRILSETDFTKENKKKTDYKAIRIAGVTNWSTDKDDRADTAPLDVKDSLYWSLSENPRYFYGVYPSPKGTGSNLGESNISLASGHTVQIEDAVIPANQYYVPIDKTKETGIGEFGTPGTREYMPRMENAYMYAAAVMPGASAGYKKVPLRFKPLFSAVKLIITARDGDVASDHSTYDPSRQKDFPAAKYRLAKVELRTDINENDIYLRDGSNTNGTPLCGKFTATFRAADISGDVPSTTGDFSIIGTPTETGKRITIDIPAEDRVCLNDDTLKLTFLALPVDQQFMTVDYTFEYLLDDSLDPNDAASWSDPAKIRTFHRTLALQDREKIFKHEDDSWYKLDRAHKLYVRSGVPAIEYIFKVEAQSFFPRILEGAGYDPVPGKSDQWKTKDFYSVVSYRDSSGVLQPLKWQVTGYSSTGVAGTFDLGNKPSWLAMCGETIGTWDPASDTAEYFDPTSPDYAANGIDTSGDPWAAAPWGYGSRMDASFRVSGVDYGFTKFENNHTYVFYDAGAGNNGSPSKSWKDAPSFNYCDPDGNYYYTEDRGTHKAGEAYAYDLSSHDIYGNLIVAKNGDMGTTANCYVVSAPGWYRFPTVYGNAFKGGAENEDAYKGDGLDKRLGWFKDHNDADITQPWVSGPERDLITPGTAGVELVWEDADDMAFATDFETKDPERAAKQKPFYWKDPAGYGYIYFFVNQVAFSNVVIAAKSGNTIVWSWHIWGVPEPSVNLGTVDIEPNEKFGPNPEPKLHDSSQSRPGGKYSSGESFAYMSKYPTTKVWKELDLGQGEKEANVVSYRHVYVEFTQYWRGKAIATRVLCLAQSGVTDNSDKAVTPAYQWGRKDPFFGTSEAYSPRLPASSSTIGKTIQNPATFYYGGTTMASTGPVRYDNLWNSKVNYVTNTFLKFDLDNSGNGGRRDLVVEKTIYDPSPPGFHMPNLFAFTGFNSRGLFQTKIPMDKVAFSAKTTYDSGKYYDFATKYRDIADYRRNILASASDSYVRFYARGRRNASDDEGLHDKTDDGMYWLAEPAANGSTHWSYGSSFMFQKYQVSSGTHVDAVVYPVAGGESVSGGSVQVDAKWQRTHGLYVRPMKEP